MNSSSDAFKSLRTLSGGKGGKYVIAAMFTDNYRLEAERLAASCHKFALPYEMHEVPTVHNSISVKGSHCLSYTKPNFIRHMLAIHKKPVLYMDADCEFMAEPALFGKLIKSRHDFAIYNWFADDHNNAFVAVKLGGDGRAATGTRYYKHAWSIDFLSHDLLYCSGLVQLYGNTLAARTLLRAWHRTIVSHPGCADDHALDFTFNNLPWLSPARLLLRPAWLPKSHARMIFWIYVKPVINHAASPSGAKFIPIEHPTRKRHYRARTRPRVRTDIFPRDCIIDTQPRLLCRLIDGELVATGETGENFWL